MNVHRTVLALWILGSLLLSPAMPAQSAPTRLEQSINLQPGESLTITCPTELVPASMARKHSSLLCRPLADGSPAATATMAPKHVHSSTASPTPTPGKGQPVHIRVALQPGDTATIACPTRLTQEYGSPQSAEFACRAADPTATATITESVKETTTQPSVPVMTQTKGAEATQPSAPTVTKSAELTATLPGSTQPAITSTKQPSLPTTTMTPLSTATVTPFTTPTRLPDGAIPPYAGAPACANHDPNKWHGLWDYQLGCYYNHEHGDDPSLADGIFGPAGQWWNGGSGANIGVPWATSAHENHMKHPMSKYYVRILGGYQPFPDCGISGKTGLPDDNLNNCIQALRLLAHGGANPMEALSRNHSMAVEIYITSKASGYTTGGILRLGSWLDFGKLQAPFYSTQHARPGGSVSFPDGSTMDFVADTTEVFGGTGGEPYWFMSLDTPEMRTRIARRPNAAGEQWSSNEAGPYNGPDCGPFPRGAECGNRHVHILVHAFDTFALLNAGDVNNPYYICSQQAPANCTYNGATRSLKETVVWIDPAWDTLDGVRDGYVTYNGYTDRWQRMRPAGACNAISLDCIPIMMQNVPIGYAEGLHHAGRLASDVTDYDVCARAGFWCIDFPN